MAFGTRLGFEPLRIVAFGGLTAGYAVLGGPTIGNTRIICLTNTTDEDVNVSLDLGVTDNLRIAANSFQLFDCTANEVTDDGFFIAEGTYFYVKYDTAPSIGNFWIEIIYASAGGK